MDEERKIANLKDFEIFKSAFLKKSNFLQMNVLNLRLTDRSLLRNFNFVSVHIKDSSIEIFERKNIHYLRNIFIDSIRFNMYDNDQFTIPIFMEYHKKKVI